MTYSPAQQVLPGLRVRKAKPPIERKTHIAVADALRWGGRAGWVWTHFPAGEKRELKTAALLKRMGLNPGFADFLLINPLGVHHWLEMKRGGSSLNQAQLEFRKAMEERGVPYAVARNFDQAMQVLQRWGAIKAGFYYEGNHD